MKTFCTLAVITTLVFLGSCQKPQSEEARKAEIEREVQERLAAERQSTESHSPAEPQNQATALEPAAVDQGTGNEALAEGEVAASTARSSTTEETESIDQSEGPSETRTTASYGTFYRKLEPYGAWRETSDYGYVWQPRAAEESRGWRPYTNGHWVYTDAGWTWISDEPFGWATYHYGRWMRLRNVGWVWVPGTEWAPAWVSWRTSNEYVGWAPLPPEARFDRRRGIRNWADSYYDIGPDQYSFVPGGEFGSERIERAVVPVERNVTIVNETTNVTNITYSNTTVVNQGPNYEQWRSRGQRPIQRYRLERRTQTGDETAPPVVRGEMIEMPAPVIGRVPGMDRPRIRETLTQAIVETGWSAIADRSAAERARAKIKAEATPPPGAPPRRFVRPRAVPNPSPRVAATLQPSSQATTSATPAATATLPQPPSATAPAAASPSLTPRRSWSPRATPSASPIPVASPIASAPGAVTATPAPRRSFAPRATPPVSPSLSAAPQRAGSPSPSVPAISAPTTPRRSFIPKPTPPTSPAIPPSADSTAVPIAPSAVTSPSVASADDQKSDGRLKLLQMQQQRAAAQARKAEQERAVAPPSVSGSAPPPAERTERRPTDITPAVEMSPAGTPATAPSGDKPMNNWPGRAKQSRGKPQPAATLPPSPQ
jgi:hypothetical protein